jgi:hypothetical protein
MIAPKILAGVWESGPGGTIDFRLDIHEDGTGDFRFVKLVGDESGQCRFGWRLSDSEDRVTFAPLDPAPVCECFLFGRAWDVAFTPQVSEFGFVRDRLTFRQWHDATSFDVGDGKKLEIPAQWVTGCFFRQSSVA